MILQQLCDLAESSVILSKNGAINVLMSKWRTYDQRARAGNDKITTLDSRDPEQMSPKEYVEYFMQRGNAVDESNTAMERATFYSECTQLAQSTLSSMVEGIPGSSRAIAEE